MPHTPGPWRPLGLSGTFPAQTIGIARIDDQTNGAIHAQVNVLHRTEEARQTAEANARLIAAAPELLEALDYLLAQTIDQDLAHGIELTEGEADARAKALSAIARATGN